MLVDIFHSAGASFLVVSFCGLFSNLGAQGLRSWGSHFWIIPRDRLSFQKYYLVPRALRDFDGVYLIQFFPLFPKVDFFGGSVSRDTHPNCMDSFSKATDPFAPPFFDFLLGFSSASAFAAILESCLRQVLLTRGRVPNHNMKGYYIFCIGTELCPFCLKGFFLCCLNFLRVSLPLRQSWPSNSEKERTIVLFVHDHFRRWH